MKAIFIEYYKI